MGIVSLPLLIYGRHISNMYVSTQKVISRHESLSVSTLLSYHSSAVIGLSTIRAFGMASAVTNRMGELADNFSANRWYYWLFTRWRGLRFALAGSIYKITVLVLILLSSDYHLDASTMGFAINFMSALAAAINETSKGYTEFGSNLEALERVVLYTDLLIEDQSGVEVPESWPANNKIEVRNLSVAYAPELPLVLQNISFTVEASQRVGIVGRTGSGKSSLILALLRLLEIRSGTITIDGIDISTVKVHDLRSRISFMSQDPVLFSGTVRSNLNYASNNSDSILEDALRQVHLLADSGNNKFTLDSNISAGGNNLSQGQKQLLCLARILIEKPKIMVLDEAMSAVDKETDRLVQDAIKNIFTGMMLVVAHRLSTVATFDRIAVIDAGKIVEWGSPQELFNQHGHFWQLIQASTEREYLWGIFHNSNI
jgi:ABC-type multidrug transport system fused ATPase/permease subunit